MILQVRITLYLPSVRTKVDISVQNHGILVATDSIEATVHFYVALEKSCQVQLLADAAAAGTGRATVKIEEKDAEYTSKVVGNLKGGWMSGLPQFQMLEHRENVRFKLSPSVKVGAMPV